MDIQLAQKLAWENKTAKGFNTTDVPLEFGLLTAEIGEAFTAWRKGLRCGSVGRGSARGCGRSCVSARLSHDQQIRRRLPGDGDVIGGGVAARVPGPQQTRYRLPATCGAVVDERDQRMVAEVFFQVAVASSSRSGPGPARRRCPRPPRRPRSARPDRPASRPVHGLRTVPAGPRRAHGDRLQYPRWSAKTEHGSRSSGSPPGRRGRSLWRPVTSWKASRTAEAPETSEDPERSDAVAGPGPRSTVQPVGRWPMVVAVHAPSPRRADRPRREPEHQPQPSTGARWVARWGARLVPVIDLVGWRLSAVRRAR